MNLNELILLIEQDELSNLFLELETQKISSIALVILRKEFEQNKTGVNFHDRLKTAIRSASRNLKDNPKKKILFLAANPSNQANLRCDQEYRFIKEALEQGAYKDQFELLPPKLALTAQDLIRSMKYQPHFIHFSGHGNHEGIAISSDQNKMEILPNRSLQRLFFPLKNIVKLVLFNSCYSALQAKVISEYGIYVIGYNTEVKDSIAITFARGLYNALGEGKTIEAAYNDAMIVSANLEEKAEVWFAGEKLNW